MPDLARCVETLGLRERCRDEYWRSRDPIANDRLRWRAHTVRHLAHLVPSQRILELGCGEGRFTRQLVNVTRGENPITAINCGAVTVNDRQSAPVEWRTVSSLLLDLEGPSFDVVVGMDVLDRRNCHWLMETVHRLLKPGGRALFYESNPRNPYLTIQRAIGAAAGVQDPRELLSRREIGDLLSTAGFTRVTTLYNDFVFPPLPRSLIWLFRNLSILLENVPGLRALAGSILVHAHKGPLTLKRPAASLFQHESLRQAVSVVIPCRNEEMNLGPLVTALTGLFGEYVHEIIPVDDSSTDDTRAVMAALAAHDPRIKPVFRRPPSGVGRAIIDGYRAATGRYVLSMDCDFQHLLPELRDMFDAAADGLDVVIGSRFSRHSVLLGYPFKKIVANRAFHLLARLVLGRRFRDLTNNLKLLRRDVVERLLLTQPGFAINAETGLQPLVMGCSVKEVPISWVGRGPDMGVSSFRLVKVGGGYCRVLYNLWLRRVFGVGDYRRLAVAPGARPDRRTEALR